MTSASWWICARNSGRPFERRYAPTGIRLLAEVDEAFGQMSGRATCEILRRAFEVQGDPRFERLAGISWSHVYNLRGLRWRCLHSCACRTTTRKANAATCAFTRRAVGSTRCRGTIWCRNTWTRTSRRRGSTGIATDHYSVR